MFPKVPQSSWPESLGFPRNTPSPLDTPLLRTPIESGGSQIDLGKCIGSGLGTCKRKVAAWMSRWKSGSMVRINGLFHLLINGVFLGVITHLLTIDPNFLEHPSVFFTRGSFFFSKMHSFFYPYTLQETNIFFFGWDL